MTKTDHQLSCYALESENPVEPIRWLQKILNASEAYGTSITSLWGAPVVERIALTDEVDIVPTAELPDSPQKRWATGASYAGFNSLLPSALNIEPPVSALVTRARISPVIVTGQQNSRVTPSLLGNHLRAPPRVHSIPAQKRIDRLHRRYLEGNPLRRTPAY